MTDLKAKLARLSSAGPVRRVEGDPRVAELRARLERIARYHRESAPEQKPARRAPSSPPGLPYDTPHGAAHLIQRCLPGDHRHGAQALAGALAAIPGDVAHVARDQSLAGVDFGRALFVDTETTGLAGGTGTVPFLIGLAWFETGVLHLHQLVLEDLGREAPMLFVLAERLASASCLVTFNGKSFDWPLLRNRYVVNRMVVPALPPHLDLLHCTRRVWRRRIERLRLVNLEQEVLGFTREDDLDGALIPLRYWDFLRGVPGVDLDPVIEHNANDVLALAALLGAIGSRCTAELDDPREALALAELMYRGREFERARRFAACAIERGRADALTAEALALLAQVDRRAGDHAGAAQRLEQALALAPAPLALSLHRELAKLYEHRLRDLRVALRHAQAVRAAEPDDATERRIARLERRLTAGGARRAADASP